MTTLALVSSVPLGHLVPPLRARLPDVAVATWPDLDPDGVEVAVCWHPPPGVLARFPKLALVHSVGAGVDHITSDPLLPDVPVCRIVDPSQVAGMVEYILWSVLHFHRGFDVAAAQQHAGRWQAIARRPTAGCTVAVLGLGEIGSAAALTLAGRGYAVRGWSRSQRDLPGVECHHGRAALARCVAQADVVVSTLPLTPDTRQLIDEAFWRSCRDGVALVNCGRGEQVDMEALRHALDRGRVRGAVLDVFEQEPLPPAHWAWQHPRVRVTPHMAAYPSVDEVADQVALNVRHLQGGRPLRNTIRRDRGY